MKHILLLILFFSITSLGFSQQSLSKTLMHDGIERAYTLYVPANYTADEAAPLVFNLHGYGSNAFEQGIYGNFNSIADTAGFLLIIPDGTLDLSGTTHWNVGGWTIGSTVDDVGFVEAMIDATAMEYNLDAKRVYSTGMSNGGFMSFLLACQLSDKIAAVASVTGSMTPQTYNACNPQHPTPIMQIHGIQDGVVPYNGDPLWTQSIQNVVDYWVDYNNCTTEPLTFEVPDVNMEDGSTAVRILHEGGDAGATVEHYRIDGGDHTWPGTALVFDGTNLDFNASEVIWQFFAKYDLDGLRETTNVDDLDKPTSIRVYPNPTSAKIIIEQSAFKNQDFELYNILGKQLLTGTFSNTQNELDLSKYNSTMFFLKVGTQTVKIIKK